MEITRKKNIWGETYSCEVIRKYQTFFRRAEWIWKKLQHFSHARPRRRPRHLCGGGERSCLMTFFAFCLVFTPLVFTAHFVLTKLQCVNTITKHFFRIVLGCLCVTFDRWEASRFATLAIYWKTPPLNRTNLAGIISAAHSKDTFCERCVISIIKRTAIGRGDRVKTINYKVNLQPWHLR